MAIYKIVFFFFYYQMNISTCIVAKNKAREDLYYKHPEYYSFGIVGPFPENVKMLKLKYGITVHSLGCMVEKEKTCYNEVIDSAFTAQYHMSLSTELHKTIGSKKTNHKKPR